MAEWFRHSFPEPTPPQAQGWPAIAQGRSTLILAPTGSGKTLTAFLWCINRLMFEAAPDRGRRCRVLYVSPLKALAVDIERNLRAPLAGIANRADARGDVYQSPAIAVRTGDTPAIERARFQRDPSDILITTPESLYLLLTSNAREALRSVDTVIIDEIHALVPTKRGAHLGPVARAAGGDSSNCGAAPLQRIGLSATQRPLDEVARFLGGATADSSASVNCLVSRCRDHRHLAEEAPRPHHRGTGRRHGTHRTGRGDSERPRSAGTGALDNLDGDPPAAPRAHQGPSFDADLREQPSHRRAAGQRDQRARRRDAGAVAPRLARAGAADRSRRSPQGRAASAAWSRRPRSSSASTWARSTSSSRSKHRRRSRAACSASADRGTRSARPAAASSCRSSAATWSRAPPSPRAMHDARVESTRYPRNPLDVLAQQIVAMVSVEQWTVDDLFDAVRRAAPFAELGRSAFEGVLDMLSGRYPSDDFADLRPRLTWDRIDNVVTAREGAKRIAVTNGGTIPDRGLYGVFLAGRARPWRARRRARRRDGVREPRRRDVPARRLELAHRANQPRPRAGLACPGRARQDAVLEGR